MLVNWKGGERLLQIPLIDVSKPVTMDSAINHEQVTLMPGWNELAEGVWDMVLPHIRGYLADGSIEYYAKKEKVEKEVEVEKEDDKGKKTKVKEIVFEDVFVEQRIDDVRSDKAREIVRSCFNMKNLRAWAENAKLSTEIRNLVDMQIEKIEKYNGDAPDEMMRF